MLASKLDLTPYTHAAFQNEKLNSLTRYRFVKVKQRAKLKLSLARLVNILFPELESAVSTLHLFNPQKFLMLIDIFFDDFIRHFKMLIIFAVRPISAPFKAVFGKNFVT